MVRTHTTSRLRRPIQIDYDKKNIKIWHNSTEEIVLKLEFEVSCLPDIKRGKKIKNTYKFTIGHGFNISLVSYAIQFSQEN